MTAVGTDDAKVLPFVVRGLHLEPDRVADVNRLQQVAALSVAPLMFEQLSPFLSQRTQKSL